jgi:hypothetical protein
MTICDHPDFGAIVQVNRRASNPAPGSPIDEYSLQIRIRCSICEADMSFIGIRKEELPSIDEPNVSPDGFELRCPMRPGGLSS